MRKVGKNHNKSKDNLYSRWASMRQRCLDTNCKSYPRYGGRGITICSTWDNYNVFELWAISAGYSKELELDRIDNSLGYSPNNCRWVSKSTNCHNRDKKSGCFSKYVGVSKNGLRWQSYLYIKRKLVYIGTYASEVEAAIARNNYILLNNLEHKLNEIVL
jgi:hypothetical protein